MIKALIFDFDGLIVDTEICIFQTWQEIYNEYGQKLEFGEWAKCIGAGDQEFHPLNHLEKLLQKPLNRDEIKQKERKHIYELVGKQPTLPGVKEKIKSARELGLKIGIASSSPHVWVDANLKRLGLIEYFHTIRCKDDVKNPKPNPELFNLVLDDLKIKPNNAIVFEDSPNGILAAKRAGIYCVAIPNQLTKRLSISHADMILESLADMKLTELLDNIRISLS